MPDNAEFSVADAKQSYLRWNELQYQNLNETIGADAHKYIQLISLFFQINNKLLPGYVDMDCPVSVYGYTPDKQVLDLARLINNKFRYQQEGVVKNYAIESIFFQQRLINNEQFCWVFYRSGLNKKQVSLLENKIKKINQWFILKNIKIDFIGLSVDDFINSRVKELKNVVNSVCLNYFYSEVILLSGKYPVWWLVPPAKEAEYVEYVEHIKQVRLIESEECIDLGTTLVLTRNTFVENAVGIVQKLKQSPEKCFLELLVIDQCSTVWPESEGVASRIKKSLYKNVVAINPVDVIAGIMRESFSRYKKSAHIMSSERLFSRLRNMPEKVNTGVVDAYLGDVFVSEPATSGIDHVVECLNFFKSISFEIRNIFSNIIDGLDADNALADVTHNMLKVLSENEGQVPLYNSNDNLDIILDRVLLKHEMFNDSEERWSLVLEDLAGNEKTIDGFNNLLGLLAWCWLNRIVNHSTQVSIYCPRQLIKQVDAHHMLELLIQNLNPKLLSAIPREAFENPVRPLQSLIFLNYRIASYKNNSKDSSEEKFFSENLNVPVVHCDQLVINSWGDVHTEQYIDNEGILQCLCNWTHSAPIDGMARPQPLLVFSYGEGDSAYMAQRIEEIYNEMQTFFYYAKNAAGRFIVKVGVQFYLIEAENNLLQPHKLGKQRELMEFLGRALPEFRITGLERLAFVEHPLHEIYQSNKAAVFQVFFQIINRSCYSWVVDEKGSLWLDELSVFDRASYVTHWLYFFSNINKRLKNINYQDRVLPTLEINQISINQLGGVEFYAIGADEISADKDYFDLQITIVASEQGDQLNLVCDGKMFSYDEYQNNALVECVQYLSARIIGEGRKPVYITDVDVPLRIFDVADRNDVQISHILKFKRKFEHRINKMLDG